MARNVLARLLFLLLALTTVSSAETFKNPQLLLMGSSPTHVVEGDVNGDGRPDLIYSDVTNYTTTVHILLNRGGGQFTPGQDITFPTNYQGIFTLADINADGKPDLVLAPTNGFQVELQVALGNGDGTFQPSITSNLPNYAINSDVYAEIVALTVGDLNGDGAPDLIFVDIQAGMIGICLGDRSGHFNLVTQIRDYNEPNQIFLGDYNGDGKPDFVVHDFLAASATVYLGNGDGTYAPGVTYTGPDHISSVFVKDMDGDGHPDMVISGFDNVLRILHGNADGSFVATASTPANVAASTMPVTVLDIDDYNHDGTLDLALQSLDGIHILIGQGSFTYSPLAPAPVTTEPGKPAIGDLNSDGNIDMVFPYSEGLAILYGKPDGSLLSADAYDMRRVVSGATLADFNGDKKTDIAIAVDAPNAMVLSGVGDGTFTLLPDANGTVAGNGARGDISSGDFNGDGRADVLLAAGNITGGGQGVFYQLGNGDGTFGPVMSVPGYGTISAAETVGDLNNDGRSDIAVTGYLSYDFLLGQANGTFQQAGTINPNGDVFAFGDFNKDRKRDAAVVGYGTLQVFNGKGDGTFNPGFTFSNPPSGTQWDVNDAVAVDLDGDGNLDIAAPAGPVLEVFYGHGDGTFDPPVYVPYLPPPGPVCCWFFINAADFNRDGRMDLVLSNGALVSVLHGTGYRTFGDQVDYVAGDSPVKPQIADLNGDGYPDIVVANNDVNRASTITVLLNIPDNGEVSGTLKALPEPSYYGSPFSLQISLVGAVAGSGTPTGTVTFGIDGSTLGTSTLNNGVASIPANSAIPVGNHTISASYSGDSVFHASTFTGEHTVLAVVSPTQASLQVNPNPADAGVLITFNAQVTSSGAVLGGTVTFKDSSTTLGTGSVGNGGLASFSTSSLLPGTHIITAIYGGTTNYGPSTSNAVNLLVNGYRTTTTLTAMPNPSAAGTSVALQASISAPLPATGTVSFLDGSQVIAQAAPNAQNTAIVNTASLAIGTHTITTSYSGDSHLLSSVSPALRVVIIPFSGDFKIAALPESSSIYYGMATHFDIGLTSSGGFSQTVSLSCSGLPAETTCSFNKDSIAGGNGESTVVIQTSAPHQIAKSQSSRAFPWGGTTGSGLLASLAFLITPRRLRKRGAVFIFSLWVTLMINIVGCGAPGPVTGGTPPGTYNIAIVGTASEQGQILSHSATLKLTVKPY